MTMTRIVSIIAAVILTIGSASTASPARRPSAIADAAEQRDKGSVTTLLKQGADVNAPQPDGATALHWAAHWDDVAIATDLLRAGADPNAVNDYGITPLFLAATNGSARMIAALLAAHANPNKPLSSGETVLMTAAHSGNAAVVDALMAAGAAVEATHTATGQTALMWAIDQRHADVARLLIARGANVNARTTTGFTPLLFASREGDIDTARLLLDRGVEINDSSNDGSTPLLVATVRGHVPLALFLLDHGAAPDANFAKAGYTPLHWAVTTIETTPITYPGISAPGEWAAMSGIPDREGKFVLIKALLAHGADVNARMMKRMIVQAGLGATTSSTPDAGATPFLAAAASADAEVMRLLVSYGANPLQKMQNGATAVMMASNADIEVSVRLTEAKRLEAVRLAFDLGNDLEAMDARGRRAIHVAADCGLHEIITFLVQHGADLNAKSAPRRERGYGNSVRLLEAQTPLGLVEGTLRGALYYARPATAEFLRKMGAKSEGKFIPVTDTTGATVNDK
jgi:ankyrin repeat protein